MIMSELQSRVTQECEGERRLPSHAGKAGAERPAQRGQIGREERIEVVEERPHGLARIGSASSGANVQSWIQVASACQDFTKVVDK